MDLTKIKSVIQIQLLNTSGLASLQLQNHIYGCFIIMEDIAEKRLELSNHNLTGPHFVFDMDKQFSQIGLRYGFIMDTKVLLDPCDLNYKNTWLEYFNDISLTLDIELVDLIEDALIEVIQQHVPSEESFFIKALDTGSLPQEWIEKVLKLLNPSLSSTIVSNTTETKKSVLSQAVVEMKSNTSKHRKLALTRKNPFSVKEVVSKRCLSKTRRAHSK